MREFVGRQNELSAFSAMLARESESRIFNVTGFGGIGKSTLVEKCGLIAKESHHTVALVNARRLTDPNEIHNYPAAVEAIIALEQALREGGCDLRDLRGKLERYRHLYQQLTEKFAGAEAAAVATILQLGIATIRAGATVFPVVAPLNAVLTPELATKVSQAIARYRQSDRRLLNQPVEVLTALLLAGLNTHTRERNKRVVLIFDEFELIPVAVERWLNQCFSQAFGMLDPRIMLVVASRFPIGQDWIARGQSGSPSTIKHIHLEGFTNDEVVEYLMRSDIGIEETAARRLASRLGDAYHLPLALRLFVSDSDYLTESRRQPRQLGILADNIVDRLLDDRYTNPEQRRTALTVAVARRFDSSLILILEPDLDPANARGQMEWLTRQHFVNPHAAAYSYYDLVRGIFLSHLENTDRQRLDDLHERLGHHYEQLIARGGHGERMRNMSVELAYHQLSCSREDVLAEALKLLFQYLPAAYEYSLAWSRMLRQVLDECDDDLLPADRDQLDRLASMLERSSQLSVPSGGSDAERTADPALNILFSSSFDDSLPHVTAANAELWLAYFESRLNSVVGGHDELSQALRELSRVWDTAQDLIAYGANENLLTFRVACDIADIYTRRGDLANALDYSRRAVAIAVSDNAPIRRAFALYQLSNNLKRRGHYRSALENLSEAIDLVRHHPGQNTNYYLGRMLLDKAVTLTYVNDSRAAEETYEASRAYFKKISPMSYAELSHRLGWLKRVRGDLVGALADHETAIKKFREVDAELGTARDRPSHVSYPLAKALHSIGNVYVEMCRHDEALSHFDEALQLFDRQDGVRHEAIVRKDQAWSLFIKQGPIDAEENLIRAITDLGPHSTERERPAINSATHLAECWLMLSTIRSLARRFRDAEDAVERAASLIGRDENVSLLHRVQLQRALIEALRGRREAATSLTTKVFEAAMAQDSPQWMLAARAALVEAVAATIAGDIAAQRSLVTMAWQQAGGWNEFGSVSIDEMWAILTETMPEPGTVPADESPSTTAAPEPTSSADEMIDIYDEQRKPLGQASSRVAHTLGLWHRSFHCWIVRHGDNGKNLVLLQRRGPYSLAFPNFFDMSAAGHYRAGEGIEGGIRECREELSISVDAADLQPIARRVINEELSNGTINREFQDIYLLCRPVPANKYSPNFPEVSALVECSLSELLRLVDGELDSAAYSGVSIDPDTRRPVAIEGSMTRDDLIAESRAYHRRVLRVISVELDRQLDGPFMPSRFNPSEQLDDGSVWTVIR